MSVSVVDIPESSDLEKIDNALLKSEEMNFREGISSKSEKNYVLKCLKAHYQNKNVDEFVELLQKSKQQSETILNDWKFDQEESLFEFILKTDNKDHAEFIRQIWIEFELYNNEDILTERNAQRKLPIDYVLESESILNLICFLVYDYNTPKSVGSTIEKKYFLKLKNEQYLNKVGEHLLFKLYSVIKDNKINQGTCLQIMEELLKEKLYSIKDIEIIIRRDEITKSLYDDIDAEILNLVAFYWDFDQNPVEFEKHKEYLAARSPFCKIILALRQGTEDTFIELFDRYLKEMKDKYKKCPILHELMLQKDRKYLLNNEMFSEKYKTFENNYHIIREIKNDPELLDLHDDFIFKLLSPEQQKIYDQILESTNIEQLCKIIENTDCEEMSNLLVARSQESYENLLEKMVKTNSLSVLPLLDTIYSTYEMESFFTKKMLLMRNPLGNQLIEYNYEVECLKMFSFLCNVLIAYNKRSLLLLLNEQLKDKFDTSIFKILYTIIQTDDSFRLNCMLILENLLIEMVEIEDMESECDIETVFKMDSEPRDDIFEMLFFYWKPDPTKYKQYKVRYSLTDKFYNLMLMLKFGNDDNFAEAFELDDHQTSGRAEVLLSLALKHGRKKAMKSIVELHTIDVRKLRINTDRSGINCDENNNFLMKLLLKHGHNLHDKVNSEEYKESLDARVGIRNDQFNSMEYNSFSNLIFKESVENYIRIDYKSFCNVFGSENSDKPLFSCKSILNTRGIRDNMTHPVLSIIINLKALEFQQQRLEFFWIFIVNFYIPFFFLLFSLNKVNSWWFWCIYVWCLFMVCFGMLIFVYVENINIKKKWSEWKSFLKDYSTQIDVAFLMLSALILVLILIPKGVFSREGILTEVSVIFILVATIKILKVIPYPSITIIMLTLKRAAMTFRTFLLIVFSIIFTLALTFFISIKPVVVSSDQPLSDETFILTKLELETIIANSLKKFDEEKNVAHNINNPLESILKTIQMIMGEYTIEPNNLDTTFKQIVFLFFVSLSYIIYDFIISLESSDIQKDKKETEILILRYQMENTMKAQKNKSEFISKSDYTFLNNLKYLVIDKENREVFMENNHNQNLIIIREPPFLSKPYKITNETLESLIDIVNKNKIIEENRVQS